MNFHILLQNPGSNSTTLGATPKSWEQSTTLGALQNPGSNSKTLGAIPKPWEQPPLPHWSRIPYLSKQTPLFNFWHFVCQLFYIIKNFKTRFEHKNSRVHTVLGLKGSVVNQRCPSLKAIWNYSYSLFMSKELFFPSIVLKVWFCILFMRAKMFAMSY